MNNLACCFGFQGFRADYATLDHQVGKYDVTVCFEHAPTAKNPLRRTATLKRLSLIRLCANAHKGGRRRQHTAPTLAHGRYRVF